MWRRFLAVLVSGTWRINKRRVVGFVRSKDGKYGIVRIGDFVIRSFAPEFCQRFHIISVHG